MSMQTGFPIGPGWLIFFQDIKRGGPPDEIPTDYERIMKDDNEIIELVTMMVNCDVIF